jgi:hypothetical protein
MRPSSPTRGAPLRMLHGEPDVHVVAPAPGDISFARMLTLTPNIALLSALPAH